MQQIGRYQVLEEIARGGMGVVYRALDPGTQRIVALKLMLRLDNKTARRRFQREADALARVSHLGVVRLFDYDLTPAGQPFMVMEVVSDDSLQARLDRGGPLAPDRAVTLTLQLCDAVAACHAAGVLHRDLKPENVLLDARGRIKLVDFGITCDTDPSLSRTRLSQTGQLMGTPGYWAPEQASGKLDQIGERTDVYGIGATLFALLTGQPPNQGETLVEILSAVVAPKPAPSSLNPAVPSWLDAVVGRALATEPSERFQAVEALSAALQARGAVGGEGGRRSLAAPVALSVVALGFGAAVVIAARADGRPGPTPSAPPDVAPGPSATTPSSADRAEAAKRAAERARRAFDARDYQAAITAFSEGIRLQPDDAELYRSRGVARQFSGDNQGAIEDYTEAIRLQPDLALAYRSRGGARLVLRDFHGAVADYDQALRTQRDDAMTHNSRGSARQSLGDVHGAIADYGEALRLRPDFVLALNNRGVARQSLGDVHGAIADYEEALRLQPKYAEAYLNRGLARAGLGDWEAAIADYDHTIQLQPGEARAYYSRGNALAAQNDWKGAVADYDEAIRFQPEFAEAHYNRALARAQLGDWKGAVADYDETIRLEPQDADAYEQRGLARGKLGDPQGAILDYDEVLRLQPDYALGYVNRGSARGNLGHHQGAIEDWERALELEPTAHWAAQVRQNMAMARQKLAEQQGQ